MPVEPVVDWAKAKDEYVALTGIKKPRPKVLKFFSTSHTGLSAAIGALEDFKDLSPKDKTAKKYLSLKIKFATDSSNYIKLLTTLIDEEDEKTFKEYTPTITGVQVKKVKTDMYRGLKMLKAKLENYASAYEIYYDTLQAAELGTEKIARLEAQFMLTMKNGAKRFIAAMQAVKATPTIEVWNREFRDQDGARSLTTALGTYRAIEKELAKTGTALTADQANMLAETDTWTTRLSPWANGNKTTLPQGSDVLAELKQVSTLVKQCITRFNVPI